MVVVDNLDKWLYFRSFCYTSFRHVASHLRRVALDASYESMWKWMSFASGVFWLDDNDLSKDMSVIYPEVLTDGRSSASCAPPLLSAALYVGSSLHRTNRCLREKERGVAHTFLPAYLPRVMIATRPTLRTRGGVSYTYRAHGISAYTS